MEGRRKRKMIMNRNKNKEEKKIQKIIDAQEQGKEANGCMEKRSRLETGICSYGYWVWAAGRGA